MVLNGPQVSPPVVFEDEGKSPGGFTDDGKYAGGFTDEGKYSVVLGGAPAVWCDRSVIGTVEIHRIGSRKVHPKSF